MMTHASSLQQQQFPRMDDARVSIDNSSFRSKKRSKNGTNRYEESSINSEQNEFLKEYPNYSFRTIDESPQNIENNRSATISLHESPNRFKKKGIVEELSEKNQMLRREVQRVEKILNVGDHKKEKRMPQINDEVLRQELSNAYKQIRMYENEVAQRKKLFEHEGTFVDKIRKTEFTLLERQQMVKRLEAEISETKRQSNELVKLLQDGHIQKEYANKSSRLHKEIKYYENMLKEEANLQLSDQDNSSKKKILIKNMENELLEGGFSKVELTIIKSRFEAERTTAPSQLAKSNVVEESRSQAAFEGLKSEMTILKKMQKDYTKKIEELQKQKAQALEKSKKSRQSVQLIEKELEETEQSFINLKKSIDPAKLRPSLKNGTNPNESNFSQFMGPKSSNPLQHRFDVFEAGYHNKKSTIFNDRLIIGRKSAKIIELTIFENRTQFLGFQATYLMSDTQKKGGVNVLKRQKERFFKQKTVRLQDGDYFKAFECVINKENIITGLIAISYEGKTVKSGYLQGMKMQFLMDGKEYPCCLYGSYSEKGIEMLGIEKVQGE